MSQLPIILEFFVPGSIFLSIFIYMTSRDKPEHFVVLSIIISYILKVMCSLSHIYILPNIIFTWCERAVILIIIAIISSVICILISESKLANKLAIGINHKTLHKEIWSDIIDYKKGTTLRLFCDDIVYTGVLLFHEENGDESWFALEDYIIEKNGSEYSFKSDTIDSKIAIRLKDVKRVELYTNKEQEN